VNLEAIGDLVREPYYPPFTWLSL